MLERSRVAYLVQEESRAFLGLSCAVRSPSRRFVEPSSPLVGLQHPKGCPTESTPPEVGHGMREKGASDAFADRLWVQVQGHDLRRQRSSVIILAGTGNDKASQVCRLLGDPPA